jgi:hypothetical protein
MSDDIGETPSSHSSRQHLNRTSAKTWYSLLPLQEDVAEDAWGSCGGACGREGVKDFFEVGQLGDNSSIASVPDVLPELEWASREGIEVFNFGRLRERRRTRDEEDLV